MVDTSSSQIEASKNVVALSLDKLDSAAEIYYGQVMSLIKLRQKGATKVSKLPSGVFRCILELQSPIILLWKYSDPYVPIESQQDRHFPAIEKLDYSSYLVAVIELPNTVEFQFTLKNGSNCGTKGSEDNWTRTDVQQPQAQLSKIEIGYFGGDRYLNGLKFYSKDGAVVLQTGYDWAVYGNCKTHTVHLEDSERVIGYKSRTHPDWPNDAYHLDFQLVIGRLV